LKGPVSFLTGPEHSFFTGTELAVAGTELTFAGTELTSKVAEAGSDETKIEPPFQETEKEGGQLTVVMGGTGKDVPVSKEVIDGNEAVENGTTEVEDVEEAAEEQAVKEDDPGDEMTAILGWKRSCEKCEKRAGSP
jgi:hypothetical protein